jgi:hypothetical protein
VNTYQKNSRIGATVSVPISKHQSLKISYNNGAYVLYGGNYQSISVALAVFLAGKTELAPARSREVGYCCTGFQPGSGSNSVIAVAMSVVPLPKSFSSSTPS